MQQRIILLAAVLVVLGAQAVFAKQTICHFPPDNPDNARTVSVGDPAVLDHLAHGDCLGECPCPECGNGECEVGEDDTSCGLDCGCATDPGLCFGDQPCQTGEEGCDDACDPAPAACCCDPECSLRGDCCADAAAVCEPNEEG